VRHRDDPFRERDAVLAMAKRRITVREGGEVLLTLTKRRIAKLDGRLKQLRR
jgi:hypothetical protein